MIGNVICSLFVVVGLIATIMLFKDFVECPQYIKTRSTERYPLFRQYFGDEDFVNRYFLSRGNSTLFSRVYWMIIDMLPIYAVKPNPGSKLIYQNQFTNMHRRLIKESKNSATYIFISEAPTMTVSRVYSLATGSPTSPLKLVQSLKKGAVDEDSWIEQLYNNGIGIIQMGDLWWSQLFPHKFFKRKYSQSGYDSKGLDYLIMNNIDYEYAQEDWKVMITHNNKLDLSVHSFGWNSSVTVEYIHLNDENIEKAMNKLPNDSLLLVFGDHGSRKSDGYHGGGSQDELESGMFAYSKKGLTFRKFLTPQNLNFYETTVFNLIKDLIDVSSVNRDQFDQIGIVPTMASIFNVPIPYSSLGVIIPELINYGDCGVLGCFYFLFMDHLLNFLQVRQYVEEFVTLNKENEQQLADLNEVLNSLKSKIEFIKINIPQFLNQERNLVPISNISLYREVTRCVMESFIEMRKTLDTNWKYFGVYWTEKNLIYRLSRVKLRVIILMTN